MNQPMLSTFAVAVLLIPGQQASASAPRAAAYHGEPFGVAMLEFTTPAADFTRPDDHPVAVVERDRRVLYPVVTRTRETVEGEDVVRLRARFLFRGKEPLHVGVVSGRARTTTIEVTEDEPVRKGELQKWWADYKKQFESNLGSEPTAAETYLLGMLSRRLGFQPPRSSSRWRSSADMVGGPAEWTDLFALLTGTASVRTAMQRTTLLDVQGHGPDAEGVPMPEAVVPPPIELPEFEDPEIEAIARHVPEECFYIRYARPSNIAWLAGAADNFTTLLGGFVSSVTFDDGHRERLARQLALPDSTVARLFADEVVTDVAMIGTDLLVEDGAAVGFVFEVGLQPTFDRWIQRDRDRVLASTPGVERTMVELTGEGFGEATVERLATQDNQVRSFLVRDGRYRLVTNSRFIARRFLEAGRGHRSLGGLREFGYARSKIGVDRRDPIFAYLSDPFFRSILGPHYRVEMTRRVRARGEIELVELARLAFLAEGHEGRPTIERLIETNLLPESFGERFDGSRPVDSPEGLVDSERGAPGTFLPVPDTAIEGVTPAERSAYLAFGRAYARVWQGQRLDPVVVAVHPAGDERDPRVAVDVLVTPFARAHYPDPTWFAAPEHVGIEPITNELFTVDVVFPGQIARDFGKNDDGLRPFHVIGGLLDFDVALEVEDAFPKDPGTLEGLGDLPLFLALSRSWESMIPSAVVVDDKWTVTADAEFRGDGAGRELATAVGRDLKFVPTDRAAQLRARLADLGRSKLRPAIETVVFCLARQASTRNVLELHRFGEQFRLDPMEARREFERVHRGRLVCPLGGDYVLADDGHLDRRWRGTFWPHDSLAEEDEVPQAFRLPALDWFRGVDLEFSLVGDTLVSHVEVSVPKDFLPEDAADVTERNRTQRVRSRIVTGVPVREHASVRRVRELGGLVHYVSSAAAFGEQDRGMEFPAIVTIGSRWTGTAEDWNSIAAVPLLGGVLIERKEVTADQLRALRQAPSLRGIDLGRARRTKDVLEALADFPKLETLSLDGGTITRDDLLVLAKCRSLKRLAFGEAVVDGRAVDVLKTMPALQTLSWRHRSFAAPHFPNLHDELRRIAPGQRVAWASDGKRLVFSRLPSGRGINLLELESNKITELFSPGYDPAWRPGHEQIAYVRKEKRRESVWLYDLESKEHRRVAEGGFPGWSADGKQLFLHSRSKQAVLSIAPDDTEAEPVEFGNATKWYPAVSPDGKRLAMQIDQRSFAIRDLQTGTETRFEFADDHRRRGFFPGWSPNGTYLAYGGYGHGDGRGLWVLDSRTEEQRQILAGDATMPVWSPDGTRMAYDLRTRVRPRVAIIPTAELGLANHDSDAEE